MISKGKPDHITGEASSGTLTYPGVRGDCCYSNRKPNLAQTMRAVIPSQKIIIVLRNPSERFYAAFSYYRYDDGMMLLGLIGMARNNVLSLCGLFFHQLFFLFQLYIWASNAAIWPQAQ